MKDPGRVVILGAGPTGLGAAYRLQELGVHDVVVVEGAGRVGGLAGSELDDRGFTWDVGGHVGFSHYDYYDRVLDRALGDAWLEHDRESWIWIGRRWMPYPFQYNLHRLPDGDRDRALAGLERALARTSPGPPANFSEWIDGTFGEGIADLFLRPYNSKVWGVPLETLGVGWMGERVAIPDLERVRRSIRHNRDETSWGPNHRFRYPRRGGTGAVWTAVASLLDGARLQLNAPVTRLNLHGWRVELGDGRSVGYDHVISSLPLDVLVRRCEGLAADVARAAEGLRYSSCHIVGVGLRGDRPASLATKCWMYFPEPHSPYYRVTVLSNYSHFNVPAGDGHWSLLAEVCETAHRPVDVRHVRAAVLEALRADGLIGTGTDIVSVWHRREEHGYPTPVLERDALLSRVLPALEERHVYSRGRFGAWKYEVSNQDHSFMQGVEIVNRLVGLGDEPTLHRPDYVNGGAFLSRTTAASTPATTSTTQR